MDLVFKGLGGFQELDGLGVVLTFYFDLGVED